LKQHSAIKGSNTLEANSSGKRSPDKTWHQYGGGPSKGESGAKTKGEKKGDVWGGERNWGTRKKK